MKLDLKPPKHRSFSVGPKMSNVILTRFRRGRTDLNHIRFTLGLTDDPSCLCHFKLESSEHYMLDCFLYTVERQNLYNLVEHLIPKFPNLSKKEKFIILMKGIDIKNPELYNTNKRISFAVQSFITKTKRFT